jgi:acyl transferase domain-containing protein
MLEYALAMALQEELDVHPSYVLGAGLGEAVAAAVCGAVDPFEMLSVVLKQAFVLQDRCDEGGMIAITQGPMQEDAKRSVFRIFDKSSLVTIYHCGHYILAAPANTLSEIKDYLGHNHIAYRELPIKYALHSPLIDTARSKFLQCSRKLHFSPPSIPFISGVYATQLYTLSPYYLWQSMREQIRFSDAMRHLEATGKYCYIDCSPWGALQPICNEIIHRGSASSVLGIITPSNQEQHNLELIKKRLDYSMPALYRNSL